MSPQMAEVFANAKLVDLSDVTTQMAARHRARAARPVSDEQFDRNWDAAEGGPDIIGNIYA